MYSLMKQKVLLMKQDDFFDINPVIFMIKLK